MCSESGAKVRQSKGDPYVYSRLSLGGIVPRLYEQGPRWAPCTVAVAGVSRWNVRALALGTLSPLLSL